MNFKPKLLRSRLIKLCLLGSKNEFIFEDHKIVRNTSSIFIMNVCSIRIVGKLSPNWEEVGGSVHIGNII